jgi:arylsulfatase A-like enzyme
MEPKPEAAPSQLFRGVFGSAFKQWLFVFVTVLVPLDLLYRLGALVSALPLLQIVHCFASMVIFFAILGLFLSLLSLVAAWVGAKISQNGAELVKKVNIILGILFVAIIFSDYLYPWVEVTLTNSIILVYLRKLRYLVIIAFFIIIAAGIIFFKKKYNDILERINIFFGKFFKLNAIIVIFSGIMLLSVGIAPYFANQNGTGSVALTEKSTLKSYPNIILVTFDALAAQHTSLYGYHRNTTPNLDKLGRESYVFDNMFSSCNWTMPSLSSLLSGKHPSHHKLNNRLCYFFGNARNQNLPMTLKALGYETAVAWSNGLSCPLRSNLAGIDHVSPNFSLYKVISIFGFGANPWLSELIAMSRVHKIIFGYTEKMMKKSNQPAAIIRPDLTFANARELINNMQKPFFIWMHVYPPHAPYLPIDDFMYSILKERVFDTEEKYVKLAFVNPYSASMKKTVDQLEMRYDETIASTDNEFGKFLSFLKEKGLYQNSILIFSSDHGEMFDRGFWGHGGPFLYQSLANVPLLLHLPGQVQGQRIGANVSQVDIAPTVLDFLGVTPPKWMDGGSFRPTLKDNNFDTGTKFSMNLSYINLNTSVELKTKVIAAIKGNYKLIDYLDWNRYELYDLKNDSQEKTNLIKEQPVIFSSLKAQIDQLLAKSR